MAWLQFGSVFPLFRFSLLFFVDFFFFYSRYPHVPVCPSSHLFWAVAAPHGTLTAASWANVGSRISRNGSGKAQLPRFCEIVFALFGVRVPARYIPLVSIRLVSAQLMLPLLCSYHLAEVIHAGVEIVA